MIVATARAAADLLQPLFADAPGERYAVLHLDADRRLIEVAQGEAEEEDGIELPVRSIVEAAFALGSAGLVLAHNHPSGDPRPSRADIDATRRVAEALALLQIRLHDHLIFAGGQCRSFRELGLL